MIRIKQEWHERGGEITGEGGGMNVHGRRRLRKTRIRVRIWGKRQKWEGKGGNLKSFEPENPMALWKLKVFFFVNFHFTP